MRKIRHAFARLWRPARGTLETILFSVFIPRRAIFGYVRGLFYNWGVAEDLVRSRVGSAGLAHCRRRYSDAVQAVAKADYAAEQRSLRFPTVGLLVGLTAFGILFATMVSRIGPSKSDIIIAFAFMFLANGFAVLPIAPNYVRPWRRLGTLAVIFSVVALMGILASGGPETLNKVFRDRLSYIEVIAISALGIATFDLYGFTIARISYWRAGKAYQRYLTLSDNDDNRAIVMSVYLLTELRSPSPLSRPASLRQYIRFLSDYLEAGLGARSIYQSGIVVKRYTDAATSIKELDVWLSLPQADTAFDMAQRVADLASALLSGFYHELPQAPTPEALLTPSSTAGLRAHWTTILRRGIGAVVPVEIYLGWRSIGPGLPAAVDQWLGSIAVLWLILNVVKILDPNYASAWGEMRDVLPVQRK